MKKVLAISSSGGHWNQLYRLKFFLDNYDTHYSCTYDISNYLSGKKFHKIIDASMTNKFRLVVLFFQILFLVIKIRPDVVISTGAAPGFFAIFISKLLFKSKTIWLDSIANGEEPSLSGLKVKPWADLWLTQWADVAEKYGMSYYGEVV